MSHSTHTVVPVSLSAPVRLLLPAAAALLVMVMAPAVLRAQNTAAASIIGHVTDESGAPVPEAAVSVTSPALQVAAMTTVTDPDGNYQVLDLPAPGVYKISFGHPGFQTFVRADLNLSVGFAARVDVTMKVGQVEQTIEVTGSSPVVDTVNTAGGSTLQLAEIQDTPKGLGLQELLPMSAGVSLQGKPDVGDSNLAARSSLTVCCRSPIFRWKALTSRAPTIWIRRSTSTRFPWRKSSSRPPATMPMYRLPE